MDQLLLRLTYWITRPPSQAQIIVIAVVIVFSLAIGVIGLMGWWPSWLEVNRGLSTFNP